MYYFLLFIIALTSLSAKEQDYEKKQAMIGDLSVIKHALEVKYSCAKLKKECFNWDLNKVFLKAKSEILNTPNITIKQFHQIVRRFFNSATDYHVLAQFSSTEFSFLPFTIKKFEDRYFIDTIDRKALPEMGHSLRIGDECIEFDGKPIEEAIKKLKKITGLDDSIVSQRIAELNLTDRSGKKGDTVPQGSVMLKVKPLNKDTEVTYQFMWDYSEEYVHSPLDLTIEAFFKKSIKKKDLCLSYFNMLTPLYGLCEYPLGERAGDLGSYKSYVPLLGKPIWENQENIFDSYIYENEHGEKIGYIRIPHYTGKLDDVDDFGRIIEHFEKNTDALVLDQVHNPGGVVIYSYELISTLTNKPLITPRHRMYLTPRDILKAYDEVILLQEIVSSENAANTFPDDPYMTYEYALFLKEFYRFLIKEWNAGRTVTRPTYIGGIDHINPHPLYTYSKPILMLIDEMDFSCADFIPAIMQDNKRAKLFGTATAGAGGCVTRYEFPNMHGIGIISFTFSIAERLDSKMIESVGVKPDIEYKLTIEDIQNNFKPYAAAVNKAVHEIIIK